MKYEEILALLDKGFTPEQVMALAQTPAQEEQKQEVIEPPETPPAIIHERVVEEQPEPEWARTLREDMKSLKNTVHAQAIQQDLGKEEKKETAEDALMAILGGGK